MEEEEEEEFFANVVELFDAYVAVIATQDELIRTLRQEIVVLRSELDLPSHIITSPPTPFSVDTCASEKQQTTSSACTRGRTSP